MEAVNLSTDTTRWDLCGPGDGHGTCPPTRPRAYSLPRLFWTTCKRSWGPRQQLALRLKHGATSQERQATIAARSIAEDPPGNFKSFLPFRESGPLHDVRGHRRRAGPLLNHMSVGEGINFIAEPCEDHRVLMHGKRADPGRRSEAVQLSGASGWTPLHVARMRPSRTVLYGKLRTGT